MYRTVRLAGGSQESPRRHVRVREGVMPLNKHGAQQVGVSCARVPPPPT